MTSRLRSTPRTAARRSSASRRGVSTAAEARRAEAVRTTPATVAGATSAGGTLFQAPALLVVLKRVGQLVELTEQDLVEVVHPQVDAVVIDAALAVVVGADLLGAIAGAHLGEPAGPQLGLLLGQRTLIQPSTQHAHRPLTILQLGLLVLHGDDDPAGLVGDAHRRIGRVDRLSAGTRAAVDVDLQVVGINLHLD